MTRFHLGTAGFSRARPQYAKALSFVELPLVSAGPNRKTLARWREEVGAGFVFALAAPQTLWGERDWPLRDAEHTNKEFAALVSAAKILSPRVIVFRTPPSLRPGSAPLRKFLELVERAKTLAPFCAWEPQGPWERSIARETTKGMGVLVAADPLYDRLQDESVVYARMRGLGADQRYHEGKLEDLALALSRAEEAFVVFETTGGFKEATTLKKLVAEGLPAVDEHRPSRGRWALDEDDDEDRSEEEFEDSDEFEDESEEGEEDFEDDDEFSDDEEEFEDDDDGHELDDEDDEDEPVAGATAPAPRTSRSPGPRTIEEDDEG